MARSARRPSAARRRAGALRSGAAALGSLIADNPVLVGGSTAFLVTLFYVSANALWYQPFPHTGAFFATRGTAHASATGPVEPETTINIVRPPAEPAPSARRDPAVEQVQGILKDLGFYSGAVDGILGPNTQSAVAAYQRKVGLGASGALDDALLEQLGLAPRTASVPPRPAPRPAAPSATAPSAAPAPPQSADARIVRIQAGLKAFGNDGITLDGVVGARTRAAIREFQALFGLPETGEPDESVYAKMREIGLTD